MKSLRVNCVNNLQPQKNYHSLGKWASIIPFWEFLPAQGPECISRSARLKFRSKFWQTCKLLRNWDPGNNPPWLCAWSNLVNPAVYSDYLACMKGAVSSSNCNWLCNVYFFYVKACELNPASSLCELKLLVQGSIRQPLFLSLLLHSMLFWKVQKEHCSGHKEHSWGRNGCSRAVALLLE